MFKFQKKNLNIFLFSEGVRTGLAARVVHQAADINVAVLQIRCMFAILYQFVGCCQTVQSEVKASVPRSPS